MYSTLIYYLIHVHISTTPATVRQILLAAMMNLMQHEITNSFSKNPLLSIYELLGNKHIIYKLMISPIFDTT